MCNDWRRYDPFGAVSITAALLVFVYAISQAPQVGWAAPRTIAMLCAGAALLAVFFVIETRVEAPLLPLPLFRLSSVAGSNMAGFLLGTTFLTFVFLGTLYMQQVLGFSALAAGAAWMTASVTSLAFAGLSQKIVTRTSPGAVMAIGMTLIGAGMLWAAQAPPDGSFWRDLAGPFFVAGIGTAFSFIPISIGALTGVSERDAGVASGLLNTSQNLGGAIGVAIGSSLAASHFHTLIRHGHATAAALTGGFQLALWVCGLSGLVAVPLALGLIRRHQLARTTAAAQPPELAMSATANQCPRNQRPPGRPTSAPATNVHPGGQRPPGCDPAAGRAACPGPVVAV